MLSSKLSRSGLFASILVAIAACAESATAPSDETQSVRAQASSRYKPQADIDAQVIVDASGVASVQVTTGTLAYFDDDNRFMVDAVPGTWPLKKVHVKFCKGYQDLGLKQFSANFYWKENALDKELDNQPDSPLDPDDKDHKYVNWDRSARHSTLKGTGDVAIPFTGIPAGASVELQVHYLKPTGKLDKLGKPESKTEVVVFCIPATASPDVGLFAPTGGTVGSVTNARLFGYWVAVSAGSAPIPVTAVCKAYIGISPTPVAISAPITVAGTLSKKCEFSIKFSVTGPNVLTFRLENISPLDSNTSNNVASRIVQVSEEESENGGGVIVFTMNPTVKETSTRTVTNPTAAPGSINPELPAPRDVTVYNQNSKMRVTFRRLFAGDVRLILKQHTGGRVIDISDVTFTAGQQCDKGGDQDYAPFGTTHTTALTITFCKNVPANLTTLEYETFSSGRIVNGVQQQPTAGVFSTYDNSITYSVEVINTKGTPTGPKTWSWTFGLETPVIFEYTALNTGTVIPDCNNTICLNSQQLSNYSRIASAFGEVPVQGQQIQ